MLKEWVLSKGIFYFVFLFGFLLFLNAIFPVQSDDIGAQIRGIHGAVSAYNGYNSRLGELFKVGWGSVFATTAYFWFVNAFIGAIVVLELFALIFARLPRANVVDLSIFSLLFTWLLLGYSFGSAFFWAAGSYNYLWPYLFILAWLLPFRFYFESTLKNEVIEEKINYLKGFLLFFCGIVAGWGHELSIIFLLITIFVAIYFKIIKRAGIPLWAYFAFFGLFIGFIILFLAPGPGHRCALFAQCLSLKELLDLGLFGIIKRAFWVVSLFDAKKDFWFFLLFCVLILCKDFKKEFLYKVLFCLVIMSVCLLAKNNLLFLLFGFISSLYLANVFKGNSLICHSCLVFALVFFSILLSSGAMIQIGFLPPPRGKMHYWIFRTFEYAVIINLIVSFIKSQRIIFLLQKIAIWLAIIYSLLVALECFHMSYKWNKMANFINEQKDLGKTEIIIDKKTFKSYWNRYGDWENPEEDPQWWVNEAYAKHFGIKILIAK